MWVFVGKISGRNRLWVLNGYWNLGINLRITMLIPINFIFFFLFIGNFPKLKQGETSITIGLTIYLEQSLDLQPISWSFIRYLCVLFKQITWFIENLSIASLLVGGRFLQTNFYLNISSFFSPSWMGWFCGAKLR